MPVRISQVMLYVRWFAKAGWTRTGERARLCRLAGRKFGGRAAEGLSARIDGVTEPERLAEVGDWIIDCGTEAEFLARAERRG